MKATVQDDRRQRTITIVVMGAPDIDVTRSWNRRTRMIRPDRVTVMITDGRVRSVVVRGGLVNVKGTVSQAQHDKAEWYADDYGHGDRLDRAPDWVQTVTAGSINGVRDWEL